MHASSTTVCFVDTNVWLYAFIEAGDPAKSTTARHLIEDSDPVVSIQVINEVCINLIKKAIFSEEQIRLLIESFYEKYRVIDYSQELLLRASQLRQRYSLSYWDSTIVASALQTGVAVLYSEDMQHSLLVDDQVQIINPFGAS